MDKREAMDLAYHTAVAQLTERGEQSGKYYELSDFVIERDYGVKLIIYDCSKSDVERARNLGDEAFMEFGRKVCVVEEVGYRMRDEGLQMIIFR